MLGVAWVFLVTGGMFGVIAAFRAANFVQDPMARVAAWVALGGVALALGGMVLVSRGSSLGPRALLAATAGYGLAAAGILYGLYFSPAPAFVQPPMRFPGVWELTFRYGVQFSIATLLMGAVTVLAFRSQRVRAVAEQR